jgi:hypothetical protein
MRVVVPLPFIQLELTLHRSRRRPMLFWSVLLSAVFHIVAISLVAGWLLHGIFQALAHKPPPEVVAISSAIRLEKRPRPEPARRPVARPRTVAAVRASVPQRPQPQPVERRRQVLPAHRRELAKLVTRTSIAYATPQPLSAAQLQAQTRTYEQTIAQARSANDPVAGASDSQITPASSKRYKMNLQGDYGPPQPEGILYPLKRWIDGAYVYYYVRYLAQYADGSSESGVVPWPIRFPANADPFARGLHRMPLPGPMSDYVAAGDVAMTPLVKNCYDHRYEYCPIAHE